MGHGMDEAISRSNPSADCSGIVIPGLGTNYSSFRYLDVRASHLPAFSIKGGAEHPRDTPRDLHPPLRSCDPTPNPYCNTLYYSSTSRSPSLPAEQVHNQLTLQERYGDQFGSVLANRRLVCTRHVRRVHSDNPHSSPSNNRLRATGRRTQNLRTTSNPRADERSVAPTALYLSAARRLFDGPAVRGAPTW